MAVAPSKSQVAPSPQKMDHCAHDEQLLSAQESSPAYEALRQADLITTKYRAKSDKEIEFIAANSTMMQNAVKHICCGMFCLPVECIAARNFAVDDGNLMPGMIGNDYVFFGPGAHRYLDPFTSVSEEKKVNSGEPIMHGTRTIVTILQGFIGLCDDRGQPVLLPPGMHHWKSSTLRFIKTVDLMQHVIELGPYTIVTVDEGYAAVTQDNGKQVILRGGETHMLKHRQHKFEKFISEKIQTNDLSRVEATTGDNVVLATTATVNWQITDTISAARMAAETMSADGVPVKGGDIEKLRNDVLKQAQASLSAFIGTVRYSAGVDASAAVQTAHKSHGQAAVAPAASNCAGMESLYDVANMKSAVSHANEICARYGVTIISINIISAVPVDRRLSEALAQGAVASAQAEQAELAAKGNAKALLIKTQSEADAQIVTAEASAEATRIRARGSNDAAKTLEESSVAVDLARIEQIGKATSQKSTFFFGASAGDLPAVMSNPAIVPGR